MRVSLQQSYLLHRRPYRETSLLVEAFSRDTGRVGLVARGARGRKSRQAALLQPLHPVFLSWSGGGELLTLTAVESIGPPLLLKGQALLCAFYINELLLRLLVRFDPHPELFDHYAELLVGLAGDVAEQPLMRVFEKRLLAAIGYAMQLSFTADQGQPVREDRRYRYLADQGPVPAESSGEGPLIYGRSLLALEAEQVSEPGVLYETKLITRSAIDAQLEGKPLQTRQLMLDYRRRLAARKHE